MILESRRVFTQELGVKPRRICASGISQVRRDRLYWFDLDMSATEGLTLEEDADQSVVWLHAEIQAASAWTSPGAV